MAIAALIISIVSLLLGIIVGLIALVTANKLMNLEDKKSDTPEETSNPLEGKFTEEFRKGHDYAVEELFAAIRLSMFDMHNKMEILDFEEQTDMLLSRMEKIKGDREYQKEVIESYNVYMEERNGNYDN